MDSRVLGKCAKHLLAMIAIATAAAPVSAQVYFSGNDVTFEAGTGTLQLGQSYSGSLTFLGDIPSSTNLYLYLDTAIFFCVDGECGGDPHAGQAFLPISYTQSANQLSFDFVVPMECASGDCDLFVPGQYDYPFDLSVLLYSEPIALIGDFSDQASFQGVIESAVSTIPEPTTWAMLLIGFAMIGLAVRRRPKCAGTASEERTFRVCRTAALHYRMT